MSFTPGFLLSPSMARSAHKHIVQLVVKLVVLLFSTLLTPAWAGALFIEEMTWPEVRDAIASGKSTAIVFAGSTEQNGPHMVLGKHNFIARSLAASIAKELGNALIYPVVPFAPTGEFEYKNLLEKLKEKIGRTLYDFKRDDFQSGVVYYQDATKTWPEEVKDLDAIITSPPFFDSTRFYAANWMRLWFAGWDQTHFKTEPVNFIDELQKKDLSIYDGIFMQARERLKEGGVFVMHLGKSHKCDMAKALSERAKRWFHVNDIFEENVDDGESHGIKDRGSVKTHQYLILT